MASTDSFYEDLRREMTLRARMLTAGRSAKAGRMLPDDLVQEALAKMLTAYGENGLRSREHDSLMSLAYRTMRNLVIDEGRKKGAYLDSSEEQSERRQAMLSDDRPLADTLSEQKTRAAVVQRALEGLDNEERCFLLQVLETDSVPAAQKHCGWPPKSPYYHLRKLLARLRDGLGPSLGGD